MGDKRKRSEAHSFISTPLQFLWRKPKLCAPDSRRIGTLFARALFRVFSFLPLDKTWIGSSDWKGIVRKGEVTGAKYQVQFVPGRGPCKTTAERLQSTKFYISWRSSLKRSGSLAVGIKLKKYRTTVQNVRIANSKWKFLMSSRGWRVRLFLLSKNIPFLPSHARGTLSEIEKEMARKRKGRYPFMIAMLAPWM